MPFATAELNAAVNAVTGLITHIALLNEAGTELAGGSPAYARKAVTWRTAASGAADNNGAMVFDVPASSTVAFVGFETNISTGTGFTAGSWPVGGAALQEGVINDSASTDLFVSDAHGLSNTQRVVFFDASGAGLPTGITENVVYYVISALTDSFQVSTTSGGAAVAITTDGEFFFTRCVPESFAGQGTYTIADTDLDVLGTLI